MCKGTTYDEKIISGQSDHLFFLTDQYLPVRAHNKFPIDQQKGLDLHATQQKNCSIVGVIILMRNLGIEPRAPRRCTNGNGEFYH